MQMRIFKTAIIIFMMYSFMANSQSKDAVKKANKINDTRSKQGMVDEEVSKFLVKSADARMMDAMEGKLASKKGTSNSIRKYGRWMVKDQAILIREIKKLAEERTIALPATISNKKEDGKDDLAELSGKDFDEKFIKMMIIDHERDIKLFEKATEFEDNEVSAFAKKYLPTIQAHLDKIKAIREFSD